MFARKLAIAKEKDKRRRAPPNNGPTILLAGRPRKKQWNLTPPPDPSVAFSERFLTLSSKTS
jgi:hypothetical protein